MNLHWISVGNSGFRLRHFQSKHRIGPHIFIIVMLDPLDVRDAKKFWHKKAQELFNVKEIMWMWTSMDLFSPNMNGDFFVTNKSAYIHLFPGNQNTASLSSSWKPKSKWEVGGKCSGNCGDFATLSAVTNVTHTSRSKYRGNETQTWHPDFRFAIMSNATFILWIQSINRFNLGRRNVGS